MSQLAKAVTHGPGCGDLIDWHSYALWRMMVRRLHLCSYFCFALLWSSVGTDVVGGSGLWRRGRDLHNVAGLGDGKQGLYK